jgi:hypothetical protein
MFDALGGALNGDLPKAAWDYIKPSLWIYATDQLYGRNPALAFETEVEYQHLLDTGVESKKAGEEVAMIRTHDSDFDMFGSTPTASSKSVSKSLWRRFTRWT